MNLDRVTITGADNSIPAHDLVQLSMEYPFVEWGILVSKSNEGAPRFPSGDWISHLLSKCEGEQVKLSLHVCGRWVRSLLVGNNEIPPFMLSHQFQRVQLNFHAERVGCEPRRLHAALLALKPRQFIFQIDGAYGNAHLEALYGENETSYVDAVPLFDISGGAGVLPGDWPKPQYMETPEQHVYHGYAGGLSPDNLADQLPRIGEAAGDCRIWIDVETHVRSPNDVVFDLHKVERFLQIAKPFVGRSIVPDKVSAECGVPLSYRNPSPGTQP